MTADTAGVDMTPSLHWRWEQQEEDQGTEAEAGLNGGKKEASGGFRNKQGRLLSNIHDFRQEQ